MRSSDTHFRTRIHRRQINTIPSGVRWNDRRTVYLREYCHIVSDQLMDMSLDIQMNCDINSANIRHLLGHRSLSNVLQHVSLELDDFVMTGRGHVTPDGSSSFV